jgi:hypothetical protein
LQQKTTKQLYAIPLDFGKGVTRTVKVKAVSREVAESRALKLNPKAVGVVRRG